MNMNVPAVEDEPHGRSRLWVVFWIYGVLVSHLLFGSILLLYRQVSTPVVGAMLFGFLVYTAWIMRTVWVDAFNVGDKTYGHLARYLTVVWSLNAVLVSIFLFLGHVSKVTLPF